MKQQVKIFALAMLAYCLLLALMMLLSTTRPVNTVFRYLPPECWKALYFAGINFFIHLYAIPFIQNKKTFKWLWVALLVVVCLLLFAAGTYGWVLLGDRLFWPPCPMAVRVTGNTCCVIFIRLCWRRAFSGLLNILPTVWR